MDDGDEAEAGQEMGEEQLAQASEESEGGEEESGEGAEQGQESQEGEQAGESGQESEPAGGQGEQPVPPCSGKSHRGAIHRQDSASPEEHRIGSWGNSSGQLHHSGRRAGHQ